jgi:ribosome-associated protein YbcJ (S4-like RNA binding protein)
MEEIEMLQFELEPLLYVQGFVSSGGEAKNNHRRKE